MNHMQGVLTGYISSAPDFKYTPKGTAVLSFRMLINKYLGGSGENKREKVVNYRVTVWGKKAEFMAPLLDAYRNPNKKDAQPGVGCPVTVFFNQPLDVSTWMSKDGDPLASIEVTAYDIAVNAVLPKEAYDKAISRSRSSEGDYGWNDRTEPNDFNEGIGERGLAEEVSDIPF